MAVVWIEGFGVEQDIGSLTSKYRGEIDPGAGINIASGRLPGTSCWLGGTTESGFKTPIVNADDDPAIMVSLRLRATDVSETELIAIHDVDDEPRLSLWIVPTGGGTWFLRVTRGVQTVAETRSIADSALWRLIEFGATLDAASGSVTVRVDLQPIIETTDVPTTDGDSNPRAIAIKTKKESGGGACDVQDIVVSTGDAIAFLGKIAVYPVFPKSEGSLNEFDAFVGGDDAFESVDEIGNDENATWIESGTEGQRQTFGVGGTDGIADIAHGMAVGAMIGGHLNLDDPGSRGVKVIAGPTGTIVGIGDEIEVDGSAWVHAYLVVDKTASEGQITRTDLSTLEFGVETLEDGGSGVLLLSSIHAEVAIVEPESIVDPTDLPETLANVFRANWATDPEVESAWLTDATRSPYTGHTDRRSLRDRPIRTQTVRLTALNSDASHRLVSNLIRRKSERGPVPLYSDKASTTGESSGSSIPCDTRWRRFYPGARVMIHSWDGPWPVDVQIRTIDAVADDGLTVSPALDGTLPAHCRVYPLIDCEIEIEDDRTALTDTIVDVTLSFTEVVGASALPTSEPGSLPDGFEVVDGMPVLDIEPNWSDGIDVATIGSARSEVVGRAPLVTVDGAPPATSPSMSFRFLSREKWWRFLRFFDSRRGRSGSFLFASPESMLRVTSADGDTGEIVVEPTGHFEDVESLKYIAIRIVGGVLEIRGVESVTDGGATWTIVTSAPFSADDETEIRRISRAHIGHFDSDAITERWRSDEIVDVSDVGVVELPDDAAIEIDDTLPEPSSWGNKVPKDGLYLWVDSSKNTWFGDDTNNPTKRIGFSFMYPNAYVDWWDDVRFDAAKLLSIGAPPTKPHLRRDSDFGETGPVISRFRGWKKNHGRPIVELPKGTSGMHQSRFVLENDLAPFWTEAGFTIVICARLRLAGNHTFFHRAGVLEWTHDWVRIGDMAFWFGTDDLRRQSKETYVLKWQPGIQTRVWMGGKQKGINALSPLFSQLDPDPGIADPTLLCHFDSSSTEHLQQDGVGVNAFVSSILIYDRALDESEIDEAGRFMKRQFGAHWKDLV